MGSVFAPTGAIIPNNANLASVTHFSINSTAANGVENFPLLKSLAFGDILFVYDPVFAQPIARYEVGMQLFDSGGATRVVQVRWISGTTPWTYTPGSTLWVRTSLVNIDLVAVPRRQRRWRTAASGAIQHGEVRANNANLNQATELTLATILSTADPRQIAGEYRELEAGTLLVINGAPGSFLFELTGSPSFAVETVNGQNSIVTRATIPVRAITGLPLSVTGFTDGQSVEVTTQAGAYMPRDISTLPPLP